MLTFSIDKNGVRYILLGQQGYVCQQDMPNQWTITGKTRVLFTMDGQILPIINEHFTTNNDEPILYQEFNILRKPVDESSVLSGLRKYHLDESQFSYKPISATTTPQIILDYRKKYIDFFQKKAKHKMSWRPEFRKGSAFYMPITVSEIFYD